MNLKQYLAEIPIDRRELVRQALAAAAGVSLHAVRAHEHGKRKPRLRVAEAYARVSNGQLKASDLIGVAPTAGARKKARR